jgi:hypothetical protein
MESEPLWRERGWIPVAGDGNGNYYVLDSHTGGPGSHPVYFLDHETDLAKPEYVVASNLWHFLRFLLKREVEGPQARAASWPFNQRLVLEADPELAAYAGVAPLPWE